MRECSRCSKNPDRRDETIHEKIDENTYECCVCGTQNTEKDS